MIPREMIEQKLEECLVNDSVSIETYKISISRFTLDVLLDIRDILINAKLNRDNKKNMTEEKFCPQGHVVAPHEEVCPRDGSAPVNNEEAQESADVPAETVEDTVETKLENENLAEQNIGGDDQNVGGDDQEVFDSQSEPATGEMAETISEDVPAEPVTGGETEQAESVNESEPLQTQGEEVGQ